MKHTHCCYCIISSFVRNKDGKTKWKLIMLSSSFPFFPLFFNFFFARTITSFIYLHVLTKSSSAYQININLSFLSFLYYIYVYMKVYLLAGELNILKGGFNAFITTNTTKEYVCRQSGTPMPINHPHPQNPHNSPLHN